MNTLRPDPYDLSNFHLAMAASALAVLLIACANLANLMLARGVARRGELSLRLAIGASRGALVRQLLAEALLLAAAGGALGVFAAAWGVSIAGSEWPRLPFLALRAPHLSWRIFAFGVLATGATVVLFGLFPALRASRVNVAEPLKESGSTTTGRVRHYSWLAITQVALALMLLMSATVLAKSAYRIATTIFGYEPRGLLQAIVNLRQQQFANGEAVQARFDHLLETVRGVEGVRVAATSAGARTDGGVAISDYEGDSLSLISLFGYRQVSPDYFRALGTTVLAGRDFTAGDREAGGAAIVNEAAAQALWPNQSPVGRLIKLGHPRSPVPWVRVVGMAQNARYGTFDIIEPHLPPRPEVYLVPALDSARGRSIVFRAEGDSARVALNVARAIQAAASLRSPPFVFPMLINLAYYTNSLRFATRLFTFLGLCGMGLAAVGLYGVLAYAVSRRTREFGVRLALGARAEDLFRMVFHDGAVMFLAGTAIGAFVAMGASTLVESLLFGVPPTDAASLVISELVLLGAALLACLGPALRAMRADPVEILRAT
ncbi:MAG: FtsX-like permease family protein [Gemmatimonadetes bacterium]|nr:FtsX-like permease family protein [Gemmatimonadota bacterium]